MTNSTNYRNSLSFRFFMLATSSLTACRIPGYMLAVRLMARALVAAGR